MRLLYVYIEDYKNIKDQEFVFTNEYSFKRNNDTVSIIENNGVRDFTFAKDLYLNAIVGENGAGKSTLFEFVIKCFSSDNQIVSKFAIFFIKDSEIRLYHNNMDCNDINKIVKYKVNHPQPEKVISKRECLYNSSVLSFNKLSSIYISNISSINISYRSGENNNFDYLMKLDMMKQAVFSTQIKRIFDNKFPIIIPSFIQININIDGNSFNEKIDNFTKVRSSLFLKLNNILENNIIGSAKDDILMQTLNLLKETDDGLLNLKLNEDSNKFKKIIDLLIKNPFFTIRSINETNDSPSFSFNWLDSKKNTIYFSYGEQILFSFFARFYHEIKSTDNKDIFSLIFLDEPDLGLHPEWQRQFVDLLTHFISKMTTIKKEDFERKCEKERNSQSEEERKISEEEFDIFRSNDGSYIEVPKPIQIILTSHSPILLSDIPRDNCIFLKKDKSGNCKVEQIKEQTFGSNIHSLYYNAFFLKNGLMGQYAETKIKEVLVWLQSNRSDKRIYDESKAEEFINLIGEPVIKEQLLLLLDENNDVNKLKDKIKELQDKVKQLGGEV